ncbi:hypothetical protein, partial [Mesorhizobium sp. M7A.F.Ca.CA.004.05.2.1]|uniref:hypothetical protein n=1 Tax=Mesorhizobium sp. M7A.F.Ca.CA.004.05.2.1 TaxID=2496716 RepID=UPI0019CFF69E
MIGRVMVCPGQVCNGQAIAAAARQGKLTGGKPAWQSLQTGDSFNVWRDHQLWKPALPLIALPGTS